MTTPQPEPQRARLVVVGILRNAGGEYLLCRMPRDRGVFPGEWGLPGGGVEPGETLEQTLRREIREELGLELDDVTPLHFSEATHPKLFPDGSRKDVHMVFLLFECRPAPGEIRLSPEFDKAEWVRREELSSYALNCATVGTFTRLGLLPAPIESTSSAKS